MKKRISRLIVAVLAVVMSLQLVACGGDGWNEAKAEQYVEAALSLVCTGENNTGMEFEDLAKDEYTSARDEMIDEAIQTMDPASMGLSDASIEQFKGVINKAMASASYDIGSATKVDGGYEVPVTIHPIDLFGSVDIDKIQNDAIEMALNGEIDVNDEAALMDAIFKMVFDAMDSALDNPTYADDYEMTMHVMKDDDGNYSAPEEDGFEFGQHIFSVEGL